MRASPSIALRLLRRCTAILVLIATGLAGCAGTGDFGRPRASIWNDVVLPSAGSFAAQTRREPVSHYVHTDDEEELRDRAWRFIMPAYERFWFEGVIAELVRTRILPVSMHPADKASYYRGLMQGSFRSPASRYRRLAEDVIADAKLIGPFATVARRVIAADRVRLRSLAFVHDLAEDDAYHAAARVAENRCLIAWVRQELGERLESYRFALEHLLIEAPETEAIAAERALPKLAVQSRLLDDLPVPPLTDAACVGKSETVAVVVEETPLARANRPVVVKD